MKQTNWLGIKPVRRTGFPDFKARRRDLNTPSIRSYRAVARCSPAPPTNKPLSLIASRGPRKQTMR